MNSCEDTCEMKDQKWFSTNDFYLLMAIEKASLLLDHSSMITEMSFLQCEWEFAGREWVVVWVFGWILITMFLKVCGLLAIWAID